MDQQQKPPFLEVKGSFVLDVKVKGEGVVDSKGKFSFVLTEENAAAVLEAASPQIMEIIEQAAPLLAKAMVAESIKSQPARR